MNTLKLLPVILSFLLLAAHFYRSGFEVAAGISVVILFLLLLRESWVPRVFQLLLVLGALEWLRSLYLLIQERIAWEQPWTRLAIILLAVALFTALSGLVFSSKGLRQRYAGTDQSPTPPLT